MRSAASAWEIAIKAASGKLAGALVEGLPLLSNDVIFDKYALQRVW